MAAGAALTPDGLVGRPLARREDERVLRGRACYVDDIHLDGMAHAVRYLVRGGERPKVGDPSRWMKAMAR